jgi:hypothetical protein
MNVGIHPNLTIPLGVYYYHHFEKEINEHQYSIFFIMEKAIHDLFQEIKKKIEENTKFNNHIIFSFLE